VGGSGDGLRVGPAAEEVGGPWPPYRRVLVAE
jgi:hypothetical protein